MEPNRKVDKEVVSTFSGFAMPNCIFIFFNLSKLMCFKKILDGSNSFEINYQDLNIRIVQVF